MPRASVLESLRSAVADLAKAVRDTAGADKKELIGKGVILYLAIYAYFTGFVYLYYYYRSFNIPITGSEIPAYYFFIYAYNVFTRFWWAITPAALVIIALASFNRIMFARLVVIASLILLFPLLSWMAARTARVESIRTRTGATSNIVHLVFKPEIKSLYPPALMNADASDSLFMLSQTAEEIYVLDQPSPETGELPNASVFRIRKEDLALQTTVIPNTRIRK